MSKIYLVIGTVDRSLRTLEFFKSYEKAADYVNGLLLESSDLHDNEAAIAQDILLKNGYSQDEDSECHLIDKSQYDMEAWDNNYDTDFYISEVSAEIESLMSEDK